MENESLILNHVSDILGLFPNTVDIEYGSKVDILYRLFLLAHDILEYGE